MSIMQSLMSSGLDKEEAIDTMKDMRERVKECSSLTEIEDILLDEGLDLDHSLELIGWC